MPKYIVNECLESTTYTITSSTSLNIGEVINFNISETDYCGTVDSETDGEHTGVYVSSYSGGCCDCLTGSPLSYQSFVFENCSTKELIDVDIFKFCEIYGSSPEVGEVFVLFNGETQTTVCAGFVSGSVITGSVIWEPEAEGPFTDCSPCENRTTISAGTEVTVCVSCCDCGATGSTITRVVPPHPVWTDLSGREVILMDAIVLGGPNGLNG